VILLTDADVDGAHIRTLLLTFLFRYQPELFAKGLIYVGMPPLYKVEANRKVEYCYDEDELKAVLAKFGGKPSIQRFKVNFAMRPPPSFPSSLPHISHVSSPATR